MSRALHTVAMKSTALDPDAPRPWLPFVRAANRPTRLESQRPASKSRPRFREVIAASLFPDVRRTPELAHPDHQGRKSSKPRDLRSETRADIAAESRSPHSCATLVEFSRCVSHPLRFTPRQMTPPARRAAALQEANRNRTLRPAITVARRITFLTQIEGLGFRRMHQ